MSLQTNIYEIGTAAKARLVELAVVEDASQIIWCARRVMPHFKGKKDIVIRPRREQHLQSFEKGGQRYGMVMIRVIDFIARTSLATPEAGDDEAWYADHVPLEDGILNALAGQMLTNDSDLDYLTCPIKFLGASEESREEDIKVKNLWGTSLWSFEFHFKPNLTLSQLS